MKKILAILVWFTAFLLFAACSDFLEEVNETNYTEENYFTQPEHAEAVVNTVYANLRFITDGAGFYGESPFLMLEFPTGLANTEVAQSQNNTTLRMLTANADNNYTYVWWRDCYKGIANANLAINRIPGITMDETQKNRLIGEALFLRAFYYFHLVRIFGDVPLITEPLDAQSEQLYPERVSQELVYDLIVDDLIRAETSGLPGTDQTGRASLGAVKTLLSAVYLTMAGFPLQKGEAYYQLAADKAKEVIDNNWYSLFGDYADLRDKANKNKGEFIFQNQYQQGIATSTVTALLLPRYRRISLFSEEFGALFPTAAFVNSYDPDDKRVAEQQYFFSHYASISDPNNTVNFGGTYIFKHFDTEAATATIQNDLNWTFFRYAELLLIYAEAANEVSASPSTAAYDAVNEIRDRADVPLLSGLSKAQFREAVWRERYHELCYENKTWFDMVRTRKVFDPETNAFNDFTNHQFSYGPTLSDKYLLFPVPQREINNNTKLRQNDQW
ncbi:RagB/SusD family nutrient uptake outer membrane protein [Parapedobacter koreensis]|uniref:Starch-binding associating with outer membrane n=1 Tax=Parapedobacter koreensis TaxID=332977 RepID=A0A1H7QM83_9SPHI|nr:RagB/SusD family nutrient uptake outer membrane protein [Parapedobacter koreensis]SEL49062.1 Starch-binding associating with outer membrane [Parapedobacter koreensis]